uniref:Uncharacterized protein n=1 Tax=Lepeophtheirus salmonis TaxID=72036 RepID=A0A0K2U0H2_LEPSM
MLFIAMGSSLLWIRFKLWIICLVLHHYENYIATQKIFSGTLGIFSQHITWQPSLQLISWLFLGIYGSVLFKFF